MVTTTRNTDDVLGAYIDCALWSSYDFCDEGADPEPFDAWATVDNLAPTTIEEMREDCAAMIEAAADIAGAEWWSDEQFGHDFWLTRNGHGAGFWDRHYGDTDQARAGDELTALSKPYGEVALYTGDDGRIYA